MDWRYIRESNRAEGVAVPCEFPVELLDEGIQLRQERIWGIAAILVVVFQIGHGLLEGGVPPAAGRVGHLSHRQQPRGLLLVFRREAGDLESGLLLGKIILR